jgi:hypothetical protein
MRLIWDLDILWLVLMNQSFYEMLSFGTKECGLNASGPIYKAL